MLIPSEDMCTCDSYCTHGVEPRDNVELSSQHALNHSYLSNAMANHHAEATDKGGVGCTGGHGMSVVSSHKVTSPGARSHKVTNRGVLLLLLLVAILDLPKKGCCNLVYGRNMCDVECPKTWDPVCSTKQVTYVNICFLYKSIMCIGLRDVQQAYKGACSACVLDRKCPTYTDPVCGHDGHTYINFCTFQATQICSGNKTVQYKHHGRCAPDPTSDSCRSFRVCHMLFMPVCGSDGRTYGNSCELDLVNDCRLEADKVHIVKDGECLPYYNEADPCADPHKAAGNRQCREISNPVCGADGRTYINWRKLQELNDQRMEAFKVDIAYMGHCLEDPGSGNCRPVTVCPSIIQPVCASDGVTYTNHCQLFRTNECRAYKQWIHFLHDGSCTAHSTSSIGKAGPILTKITIVVVVFVIMIAIFVPVYYARRSHQLVTSWNSNATRYTLQPRGRYHLVATVGNDPASVSIIPLTQQ